MACNTTMNRFGEANMSTNVENSIFQINHGITNYAF